jgi:hypothetical protein
MHFHVVNYEYDGFVQIMVTTYYIFFLFGILFLFITLITLNKCFYDTPLETLLILLPLAIR